MAATSAGLMTAMAVVSAVAATTSAVVQGVQNYEGNEFAEAEAKINEAQAKQSQKQAFQESSLNSTQVYRAGRHDLATGMNLMSAMGLIGTSSESAYRAGAFNLAEDLSAMKYRYGSEAAKYGTQAKMYKQNADMYAHNKHMGVLASSINTVGVAASSAYNTMDALGYKLPAKSSTTPKAPQTNKKSYGKGGLYYG